MIELFLRQRPGVYIYMPFNVVRALFFLIILSASIYAYFHVNLKPIEYPMNVDGRIIFFVGKEPESITEARRILTKFHYKFQGNERVLNND
jgi:hypothetical protein